MRLIPLTIFVTLVFFTVKVVDILSGTEELSNGVLVSSAEAEQADAAAKAAAAEAAKPADAKPADAAPAPAPAADSKPADAKAAAPVAKADEAKEKKVEMKNPNVSLSPGETVNNRFTQSETELLQNLSKRREELDRWDRNIQIKETTLEATEKRVTEKIGKIEALQQQVSALLAQYNEQEDTKIRSLVRIYENMKPKDAARIFDEIEMPILLLVVDKMSEKKAAPILAEMTSRKAKQITVELAAQRRIDTAKLSIPTGIPTPAPAKP